MDQLNEFYTVTKHAIYHVKQNGAYPEATKIASKKKGTVLVGQKLNGGSMLSVGERLIMFIPEGGGMTSFERKIEKVNIGYWGGGTSPIVGLFLQKTDAEECFKHEDIKPADARWRQHSKNVLESIGDDHPGFSVSHHPDFALIV